MTVDTTRFRNAPPGSYVSEEGWLIIDDEAWTAEEWNNRRWRKQDKYNVRYTNDAERLEARRRASREYRRRQRDRERVA